MAPTDAHVVSKSAETPEVRQLNDLMELVLSLQQSRARAAKLECSAHDYINQMLKTDGSDAGSTAVAEHAACWASNSSLLRSWDETVAAEVEHMSDAASWHEMLQAVRLQRPDSKVRVEAPHTKPASHDGKQPKLKVESSFDNAEDMTKSVLIPKKAAPVSESTSAAAANVSGTWAARFKASLSPDQIGAVGRAQHCSDKAARKTHRSDEALRKTQAREASEAQQRRDRNAAARLRAQGAREAQKRRDWNVAAQVHAQPKVSPKTSKPAPRSMPALRSMPAPRSIPAPRSTLAGGFKVGDTISWPFISGGEFKVANGDNVLAKTKCRVVGGSMHDLLCKYPCNKGPVSLHPLFTRAQAVSEGWCIGVATC
jgi:hypothetical protein